ncbi:MAG TPA: alpha/beta hydrolase [Chloroflexota bacterium]|jgi:pimeloyl-ACP methyl ester carboxylesterase
MARSIWIDLLGAEVRLVEGKQYRTRILEAGRGQAETLVMVHGGGGHVETFARNVVPLGAHFHTVAMEMLWHGFSSAPPIAVPPAGDRNAQVGEQILDLLDDLGQERAWLLGEAAGTSVVTWLALHHPDRLRGAIFESTGSGSRVQAPGGLSMGQFTLQLLAQPTWEMVRDRLLMVMHPDHPEHVTDELVDVRLALYSRPETNEALRRYYEHSATHGYASSMSDDERARLDNQLRRLPVLVIANDIPSAGGQPPGPAIPGAEYTTLKGTGIWAHWEAPDEFNAIVRRFIERATPPTG